MYCDSCGAQNRDGANFCHKCGQNFSDIPGAHRPSAVATGDVSPPPSPFSTATSEEQISRILGGRYELRELLGRGGIGVVYRAHDRHLGMDVAIKFLLESHVDNLAALDSLKREAKAAMLLSHPNIIRLYNFEETPEARYLLMEYVKGESLKSVASRKPEKRFDESEVIKYISEVCEALTCAHSQNIVHRDIKPSNILIAADGRIRLADFGVAHINEAATNKTTGGGTPFYMSPEQILDKDVDARSDIYSLGATMYEMLTGKPPFSGNDVGHHHVHTIPDPIENVSEWMNAIVLKCLRKEPDSRWRSADELKEVLLGKKEIGVAFKANYHPEWARVGAERKMAPPLTPLPKPAKKEKIEPPTLERMTVNRTPLPSRHSSTYERVPKTKNYATLTRHAPEREQARIGLGALAGLAAGVLLMVIGQDTKWFESEYTLFKLSWVVYGLLIGLAIGIAQKRAIKGVISIFLGIVGGIVALIILSSAGDILVAGDLRGLLYHIVCGIIIGACLGIADGIYELSLIYSARCIVWGSIGGAVAVVVFLTSRYVFEKFWMLPLNWIVMGVALGFFVNMLVGFAERPWMKKG